MTPRSDAKALGIALLAWALHAGCSASDGEGSETHLVRCWSDTECKEGTRCVGGECVGPDPLGGNWGTEGGVAPTTLGQASPLALVVDATNAYWLGEGGVWRTPLSGSPRTRLATTPNSAPGSALAVDATSVYWLDATIWKVATGGGAPVELVGPDCTAIDCGPREPIAVDATSLYYVAHGNVMRVPIGGGTPIPLATGQSPGAITSDGANVYWTDATSGTVMRVSATGGTPVTIASNQIRLVSAVAVDTTFVYWMNGGDPNTSCSDNSTGTVMRAPLQGGTPTTLASGQSCQVALAVDATSVYWTNSVGSVMKAMLAGGPPVLLSSGPSLPVGLAVDSTNVYWGSNGAILKAPIGGGP